MRHTHTARELDGELMSGIAPWTAIALALAVTLVLTAAPSSARADREHTVGKGQTLAGIAGRYGVEIASLAAANGLTRTTPLRAGQVLVVPARGVVYVAAGDTLGEIANRYDVSAVELARRNQLGDGSKLREGQRLILPGFESARAQGASEQRWGKPKRRGTATLHRLSTQLTRRVRLIDDRGRVRPGALQQLGLLMRPRGVRRVKAPHPRLARLLAQVSDHFGGRPIHIISGYRKPGGNTRRTSRHVAAQALDFRIPGVALTELRDYCARFGHVGVGYYPTSNFVHLDVRRNNARWTDLAGPGEAARLLRPGSPLESGAAEESAAEAMTDEPASADEGQPPVEEEAPVAAKEQPAAKHLPADVVTRPSQRALASP
jgi:uncharacterized protein YcbK (DUF882 family)